MMNFSFLIFMYLTLSKGLYLIPEYQWGSICISLSATATHSNTIINFSPQFSSGIPQIILIWEALDIMSGSSFYESQSWASTQNTFTIITNADQAVATLRMQWLAFIDNDLYVRTGSYATSFQGTVNISVGYALPYIPVAAVFLNGIKYQTQPLTPTSQQYQLEILNINSSSINLIVKTTMNIELLDYILIYGSSSKLITGQTLFNGLISSQFYTQDNNAISFTGLVGVECLNSIRIIVNQNNTGFIITSTNGDTTINKVGLSYFIYKPCGYFCDTCIHNPPHCDQCIPSSNRQGIDCTQCLQNAFSQNPQSYCQMCQSICDQCAGSSSNCTTCRSSTARQNPPNCDICPPQKFIQAGVDNCQCNYQYKLECVSYCDNCSSSSISCLQCQISTHRTGAPNCSTCLPQYYLISNIDDCQSCSGYCNGCSTSATNCTLCNSTTSRSNPPDCNTCPSHMYAQSGLLNCQLCGAYCGQCVINSNNCTVCLASTLRINIPNCEQCQSQYYSIQNVTDCQSCNNYCNECTSSANNCIACQSNSMRTNPPDCITCPTQYYVISNIYTCQPCLPNCNNCLNYTGICIACSSQSITLNPPDCMTCPQNTYFIHYTCIQCDGSCSTCNSSGCLTCKSLLQYINHQHQCQDCPQHCSSCDVNNCFTCIGECTQCSLTQCLKCAADNYYIQGTTCIQCPNNCQTCNNQTCLTCLGPSIIINGICICQLPCLTCNENNCLSCISEDYRIHSGVCQFCPKECIACDSHGNCLPGPLNCQIGQFIDQMVQCTQCARNYYLESPTQCIKCSSQCLECSNQPYNCSTCRFQEFSSSQCQICESSNGYYSNYVTNSCYTICGDGIIAGNEQCDDDNNVAQDGCINCQISPGYNCIGLICYQLIYPIPTLNQDLDQDSEYNNAKRFIIHYNTPIQTISNINIQIQILPKLNFNYTISKINDQELSLSLNLMEQCIDSKINIEFINNNQIQSQSGVEQQIRALSSQITDYVINTNTEQDISDQTNEIINILLIFLISLMCLAVLFGGLEIFWNLLDLLQTISYLKYINTVKPPFLQSFFDMFGFLQFQNLPFSKFLSIQDYVQNYINVDNFTNPPSLIMNDGYSTSTIINIIPIFNVLLISIIIYYSSELLLYIVRKIDLTSNKQNLTIQTIIYETYKFLLRACDLIKKQWIWSGISRIFISSTYEICFTISLGLYGLELKNTLVLVDAAITAMILSFQLIITYSLTNIIGYQKKTLMVHENQYGAIYEGLYLKFFSKYYNIILIHKKFVFMISLVFFYNDPIFQITIIVLIQLIQLLVLMTFNPLVNRIDKYKQMLCEVLMLIAEVQLMILIVDDYKQLFLYGYRRIFGWICIFSLCLIIVLQVLLDTYQSIIEYYRKYRQFRTIVDQIRCIKKEIRKKNKNYVKNFVI